MNRVLRVGMKGDDVAALQALLEKSGFSPGAADGYFGGNTEKAVMAFQASKNLAADGVAGPQTMASFGVIVPVPNPQPISRPAPKYKSLAQIDAAFEKGTAAWYQAAYLIMTDDQGLSASIDSAAKTVLIHKDDLYLPVEHLRGVPWAAIAIIHSMECGNNIHGCLHNGQAIIGTNRVTTIVPKGRGPFNKKATLAENWIDGALDAIDHEALWRVPRWTIGQILKQCEAFNGTGYLRFHHAENSPYLWARTNINDGTGKYVADGVWDSGADANAQVGAAAILGRLEAWGKFEVLYDAV